MQTQRLEEARTRKIDETNRRALQVRTRQVVQTSDEKRQMARVFSKQFLKTFKLDCLTQLVDLGCLRNKREYSIQTNFIPQLQRQIVFDWLGIDKQQ